VACRSKCSGAGLPQELLFSIKTFTYSGNIVFNPVGDWIISLDTASCKDYSGRFYPHSYPGPLPCWPPLCFVSCSHKLAIGLTIGTGAGVSVLVADYTTGGADTGGNSIANTNHELAICSGAYPISGTVTPYYCSPFTMDYEISLP
jgi:hypothetical protein